jgi:hypothetical protein
VPKTILKYLLALGLLAASQQACAGAAPDAPTLDPNSIDTAIAGTMAAASSQTAQVEVPVTGPELLTPTAKPTKTSSPTPFPTFTEVIGTSYVYVSKSMYCRAGPGEVYNSLGALKAGTSARVVGRSKDAKYWIIRNPSKPDQLCWISGKYATVTGVVGAVPVFTAPPTPKPTRTPKPPTKTPKPPPTRTAPPGFTAAYSATVNYTGSAWYVQIELRNNGSITYQSVALTLEDTVTGDTFSLKSDDFINDNGGIKDTVDTLPPGTALKVSLPALTYDPTGHELNATIKLCSKTAQKGTCEKLVLTFTP